MDGRRAARLVADLEHAVGQNQRVGRDVRDAQNGVWGDAEYEGLIASPVAERPEEERAVWRDTRRVDEVEHAEINDALRRRPPKQVARVSVGLDASPDDHRAVGRHASDQQFPPPAGQVGHDHAGTRGPVEEARDAEARCEPGHRGTIGRNESCAGRRWTEHLDASSGPPHGPVGLVREADETDDGGSICRDGRGPAQYCRCRESQHGGHRPVPSHRPVAESPAWQRPDHHRAICREAGEALVSEIDHTRTRRVGQLREHASGRRAEADGEAVASCERGTCDGAAIRRHEPAPRLLLAERCREKNPIGTRPEYDPLGPSAKPEATDGGRVGRGGTKLIPVQAGERPQPDQAGLACPAKPLRRGEACRRADANSDASVGGHLDDTAVRPAGELAEWLDLGRRG